MVKRKARHIRQSKKIGRVGVGETSDKSEQGKKKVVGVGNECSTLSILEALAVVLLYPSVAQS